MSHQIKRKYAQLHTHWHTHNHIHIHSHTQCPVQSKQGVKKEGLKGKEERKLYLLTLIKIET